MGKQEKIKESYGVQWERVKNDIDENGFVESGYFDFNPKLIKAFDNFQGCKEKIKDDRNNDYSLWRPKSLQGIERNN